jgi:hypothetical protein
MPPVCSGHFEAILEEEEDLEVDDTMFEEELPEIDPGEPPIPDETPYFPDRRRLFTRPPEGGPSGQNQ